MWSGSDRQSDRAMVTVCMKIKQFTHWLDAFVLFDNGLNNWWPWCDLNTHCATIANFDHQRRHCSLWRTHRHHVWAVTDCARPPHDCKTTHNEHCKSSFKGINWWQCMPDCTRSGHWYAERVGNVSRCRWPVETAVGGCWGKRTSRSCHAQSVRT